MQRQLENLEKLKDYTSKEIKELKTRKEQFERENYDVVSDKKHLEEEPSVDEGECKKHRETPSNFRKKTGLGKTLNKKVDPEDRDTSTKRNRLLEVQDYEMKQTKKNSDKGNKDTRDEVEDKEERSQNKEEVQDIVRDKDKGSGNKPKFREQDFLQPAQDKENGA
ncbi:hypothetical protein Tco_0036840 [Tanacetum coccineum]